MRRGGVRREVLVGPVEERQQGIKGEREGETGEG